MSGFSNAVIGGAQKLIRAAIQSPNYVAGSLGWIIRKDGTAELNSATVRGNVIVGPTSGQRIVIDSASGTITMYNSSNQITGIWSASNQSIQTQNGAGTKLMNMNFGALFFNPNTAVYNNAGYLDATDLGSNQGRTQLTSPYITGVTHVAFLDLISGLVASAELNGDVAIANSFMHATSNVSAKQTAAVVLGAGPTGALPVVSVTLTALAGRSYMVSAGWHGLLPGAATADTCTFSITRTIGGVTTTIKGQRRVTQATNVTQIGGQILVPDTPGAGSVTYTLAANHESGAGSAQVSCSATAPATIEVMGFA